MRPEPPGQPARPDGSGDVFLGHRQPRFDPAGAARRAREWAKHGAGIGGSLPIPGGRVAGMVGGALSGGATGAFGHHDWPPYVDPNWGP